MTLPPPPDLLRAMRLFPDIPEEVGNGFLAPLIARYGWPYDGIEQGLSHSEWRRIFYPLSLSDFAQLRWERKLFLLDESLLHPVSKEDVELVVRNLSEDFSAALGGYAEQSRQSFFYHRARVLRAGDFCAPATVAVTRIGLKILDGNHRVAALVHSGLSKSVPVDAWIGFDGL